MFKHLICRLFGHLFIKRMHGDWYFSRSCGRCTYTLPRTIRIPTTPLSVTVKVEGGVVQDVHVQDTINKVDYPFELLVVDRDEP